MSRDPDVYLFILVVMVNAENGKFQNNLAT